MTIRANRVAHRDPQYPGRISPTCRDCGEQVEYFGASCPNCGDRDEDDGLMAITNADRRALESRMDD